MGHTQAPLPAIWNVPHPRNLNFTGREALLVALEATVASGAVAALTQTHALHGLGGVGKTQLAVEYAYRHASDYGVVWWVRAEELTTLASDYAALAQKLDLPEQHAAEQTLVVEAVRQWLEHHSGWLLIFDNANVPADLDPYRPRSTSGHILVTSRNPNWRGRAQSVRVAPLPEDEAVQFLITRTGQTDAAAASALAAELGNLPLALEQAGAYIEATGSTLADYLQLFKTYHSPLLDEGEPVDYPVSITKTWELAFEQVRQATPGGAALLNLCAFLAPDEIPLEIIRTAGDELPEILASAAGDLRAFNQAIAALRRFSFLEVQADVATIHRMVQAVTRERLESEEYRSWAAAAVGVVDKAFPFESNDVRTWRECAQLLPHALAATGYAEPLQAAPEATSRLLNQVGGYLRGRGEFAQAKAAHERALMIAEAALGPDHPYVATRLNNLGMVLWDLGDYEGAKGHYERALAIDEAAYGPDHPTVAIRLNNLGMVLRALGDLEGAKAHFERALAIDEAALGPDHSTVATNLNNLGEVLRDLGDYPGAKAAHERALTIDEAALGPNHPTVAIGLNNLGSVLQNLGDLEGAKAHFERALAIDETALGPNHPYVAIRLNNLGSVLHDLGDLEGAKAHYERALAIVEAALGPDHPDVATCLNNLGSVLQDLGDLEGAKAHYERALAIVEAAYGPDHPTVAIGLNNLGGVLWSLGDYSGAKAHFERALAIFEATLGPDHPNTKTVRNNLRSVEQQLGT